MIARKILSYGRRLSFRELITYTETKTPNRKPVRGNGLGFANSVFSPYVWGAFHLYDSRLHDPFRQSPLPHPSSE